MANEQQKGPTPVEKAEQILKGFKEQAEAAFNRNDDFTFRLMKQLIGVTSPIVTRAAARYYREERARINNLGKPPKDGKPGPNPTTRLGD